MAHSPPYPLPIARLLTMDHRLWTMDFLYALIPTKAPAIPLYGPGDGRRARQQKQTGQ
jgi:hypothetical protein